MLLVITKVKDGKRMLIIGLENQNIERLLDDQPILKNFEAEGLDELKEWEMTILGPEDTVRFVAQFGLRPNG